MGIMKAMTFFKVLLMVQIIHSINHRTGSSGDWKFYVWSHIFQQRCTIFGAEWLPIVSEHFHMVASRRNRSVRKLMTALAVVEDMWKRKGYLEKHLMKSRIFCHPSTWTLQGRSFSQGSWGISWLIRGSAARVGDSLLHHLMYSLMSLLILGQ